MHHIPHTWVNSCKEAGFNNGFNKEVGGGHNLRTGQIHAEG